MELLDEVRNARGLIEASDSATHRKLHDLRENLERLERSAPAWPPNLRRTSNADRKRQSALGLLETKHLLRVPKSDASANIFTPTEEQVPERPRSTACAR